MTTISPTWTDERVDQLRRLWQDGWSCSRIAESLGGVSRNAVIGKVHRLKLAKRRTHVVRAAGRPRKVSLPPAVRKRHRINPPPRMPRQVEPSIAPEPFEFTASAWQPLPGSAPVAMEHMTGCKWCVSDPFAPRGEPSLFCNLPADGSPYCPEHKARSAGRGTRGEQSAVRAARHIGNVEARAA